ncbi:MFS family permease [Actinokineospora baliensis]|uniref:MFS transporter n=1 Tax=Actinokineospora baliensis TaxID=547056 RepID=UPI00195BF298|nr:MFS transporter [Actinokineospora baliensis]MBM7774775.1 MFS family permease [Actinokineospora baliensis]
MSNALVTAVRERLEPLRPVEYRRVAGALMITNMGNGMQFIANVWLMLQLTDHPWGVPLVLLVGALPGLTLGPLIGMAMDRFPRRRLFVVTDLVATAVLAVVTLLSATGELQMWHLFAVVFFLGGVESTSVPTAGALVREIVPEGKLLAANATTGVAIQIGQVLGSAVAGLMIAATSVTWVLVLNMVTFLGSAALVAGLRAAGHSYSAPEGPRDWRTRYAWSRQGFTYLREHPRLLPSYVMLVVLFGVLYLLNTLIAQYAVEVLDVGSGGLGLIDAMFALGAVLGGIALPMVTARADESKLAGAGVIGLGAGLVGMGLASGLLVPMLMYASMGVTFQAFYVFRSRVQEATPVDLQGRVMSLMITSVGLCRVLVYLVLAAAAGAVALRAVYIGVGGVVIVLGLLVTIAAVRGRGEPLTHPTTSANGA